MTYQTLWEKHGVVHRCAGRLTAEEVTSATSAVVTNERFDLVRYVLIDLGSAEGVAINDQLIEDLTVIVVGGYHTNSHVEILIVGNNNVAIGFATILCKSDLNQFYPVRYFETEPEARTWIGNTSQIRQKPKQESPD